MNKNTKFARSKGFASMDDMNRGNEGTKIYKGADCNTARRLGKKKWAGAMVSAKREGKSGD